MSYSFKYHTTFKTVLSFHITIQGDSVCIVSNQTQKRSCMILFSSFVFLIDVFIRLVTTLMSWSNFCFKTSKCLSKNWFEKIFSYTITHGRCCLEGRYNEALFIYLSIPHYNNGEKLQYHFSVVPSIDMLENNAIITMTSYKYIK